MELRQGSYFQPTNQPTKYIGIKTEYTPRAVV